MYDDYILKLYLIITSAPADGKIERIFLCVATSVKSDLEKMIDPRMSSMSFMEKDNKTLHDF